MLLTVREAAALLKTTEPQVYRWMDEEKIPFRRVLEQIRFNQTELLEWATAQRLPIALDEFDRDRDPEEPMPSLVQALKLGGLLRDVPSSDRDTALRAIVEQVPLPTGLDPEFVTEVLIARENAVSTAIGHGIAVPHVRQPIVASGSPAHVSVAYLRCPVSFSPCDGKPVQTVFLIVSPTVRAHLQMLAHLARVLHDPSFRAALEQRRGLEELIALANPFETALSPSPPLADRQELK